MSILAKDLCELRAMPRGGLTELLLREISAALISAGLRPEIGGC
jgi:hypothetical protein